MSVETAMLSAKVKKFCNTPSPLFLDDSKELLTLLLKECFFSDSFVVRNQLAQMISSVRRASQTPLTAYAHILHSIAFEEYEHGNVDFSEHLFRNACELAEDVSLNNNLAYVLRRKKDPTPLNKSEVISLLLDGVQEKEPFSLINMALHFALNLSAQNDWKTADELFALVPNDVNGADTWWQNVAEKGNDIEGVLVHYFLLRHKHLEQSDLGSLKSLAIKLKHHLKDFPKWLSDDATIESLDDVLECVDDLEFDTILEDFLSHMPCSRERVDEMLEVTLGWDLWQVYHKLLTDCRALLTTDELIKLKAAYKEKFSIPLPDEECGT